ncbi:hypothetical protein BH10BAC3_BH10BAC3_12210 [soil metagenome]
MKTFSIILVSVATFLFSCKKEIDIAQVTNDKIQGKWQIDSIVDKQYFNGTYSNSSNAGTPEDYIEFRSDGRMYTSFQGYTDNSSYYVRSNTIIVIGGDSANINELTDKKLVIYNKAEAGVIGYIETTYYLKR